MCIRDSLNSTQCYNLTTEVWNDENVDLGILPIGWWGMGYTERQTDLDEQLWLINGIDPSWNLHNQTWYYSAARNAWVNTGRLDSGTFYRTSAVTLNGTVYHLSLIHISEPTRLLSISYAVFCLKKKKKSRSNTAQK